MGELHYCDECDCEDGECGCHNVQLAQFESDIIKREANRHAAEIARLRARVGELEKALRVMTDVAQEQVRRLERWSKVHNELDGAIANARAALEGKS